MIGKDDLEKLKQADEWLTDPSASAEQKFAAREHVMRVLQHSDEMTLRAKAMAIVQGSGMLR